MMARTIIYLTFALPTAAYGGFMMLRSLGAFGPITTTDDAPIWLGAIMGFVFFAGATSAVIKILFGGENPEQGELPADAPVSVRLVYNCFGFGVVAGLGALFGWIAFGPGTRHFSGSGAILGPMVGRVMFGLGAALAGLMIVLMAIRLIKAQRSRRP